MAAELLEQPERCSFWKNRVAVAVVALAMALVAGVAFAPQEAYAADCWVRMTPRDLGGGTWTDRNYVVEAPIRFIPSRYTIYYNVPGYRTRSMSLVPHGVFNGRARWGVPTWFGYSNPSWRSYQWWLKYGC